MKVKINVKEDGIVVLCGNQGARHLVKALGPFIL
jgi:hypothetical protein